MPATVIEASLGISCVFSDGRTAEFHLDGLPCRELVRDLLFGLVELIHPHGSIDSAHSVDNALPAIRQLAGHLADHGFTGGASELRRGQLIEYWMATRVFRWENRVRRMLRGFDTATGRLDPEVRELVAGRAFTPIPHRTPLPPYTETEWDRLVSTCRAIVDDTYRAHKHGLAAANRGTTPTHETWTGTI